MKPGNTLRAAFGAALALVVLGACSRGGPDVTEPEFAGDILAYVPADTPYLFATGTPLPDAVQDKLEPKIDEILRAHQRVFREMMNSMLSARDAQMSAGDAQMSAGEKQRLVAVVGELSSLLSVEGLRNAGFDRDSGLALFGNGLLPVLRIEITDADLFDAAIARIEEAAGTPMSVAELDGKTYRFLGNDDVSLIIAAFDGNAVFTLAPAGFDDDQKRQLLGLTVPEASIAATNTLDDIATEYGYTDHYVGFVDARRIAATFVDSPQGLDAALLRLMQHEPGKISDVCKAEIRQLADVAPRLVFGYDEISTDAMSGSMVVEMRSDIAAGLSSVASVVPGLGEDAGGLFSMGLGFDLKAIREFYAARLDAMEADPFECEYFADLQAGVARGREALNQPLPPVVYGLRGFFAVVDDVSGFDMANNQPPEDVDASVLIALDDAQSIIAMGAMFSPELAELNLKPDGVPVRLDLPQLQMLGQTVYAAMLEDAVAVSVGADAETRIRQVLAAKAVQPPPLFSMSMDAGRYYSLIAEGMMVEGDDEDAEKLSVATREALRDAMLVIGELYDRMSFDVRFTERGMQVHSRVTLKD